MLTLPAACPAEENRERRRELEGFSGPPAGRELPEAGATSGSGAGRRFNDFISPAQQRAAAAEEEARAVAWQAQQAGQRAAERAAADAQRAAGDARRAAAEAQRAGRIGGAAWRGKQQQQQGMWDDDDDDNYWLNKD